MSGTDVDMCRSATWAPTGYQNVQSNPPSQEMPMAHADTYTPDGSASKLVVRRTFIECVSEETEVLRSMAPRHRSEPVVPSFQASDSYAEESDLFDSSESKGPGRDEARTQRGSYDDGKSDSEDSVELFEGGEVFDGGVDYLGEEMHGEASVKSDKSDNDMKLVVKRTFIEVVENHLEGDREQRSMSDPLRILPTSEDPDALSLTEQLLERMRTMQRNGGKLAEENLLMNTTSSEPSRKAYAEPQAQESGLATGTARSSGSSPRAQRRTAEASLECGPDTGEPDPSLGPRTTVMLRNLPSTFTRPELLSLLDREGFFARYDFVYLPIDFGSRSGFGYAFINLCDVETAEAFRAHFTGFIGWETPCSKVADVTWSGTHQGFEQHVNRYRNSPVMHETMPDECKPIVLKDGIRKDFPPPTKILRPPRIRPSKNRGAKLAAESTT